MPKPSPAENAIRQTIEDHPDLPLRAHFFRGLTGNVYNPIAEEVIYTPAYAWTRYVNINPGSTDAHVTAWSGYDWFGEGISVRYASDEQFRPALLDAIRAKLADITAPAA